MKKVQAFQSSSIRSLIIANVISIILAVTQGWSFETLIWVYWSQSIIIGIFQFLKILNLKQFSTKNFKINGQSVQPTEKTKRFTAFFFAFHFGFFHFVYMIFLGSTASKVAWLSVLAMAIIFFANHLFSYLENKSEDAKKMPNIGTMMFFPYARIIPMHLTIIFGFLMVGGPISLTIFLGLKTIADVVMHSIEHHNA